MNKKFLISLIIIVLFFFGYALKNPGWIFPRHQQPLPELVAGPVEEFNNLVQQRFPLGTVETEIIKALSKDGFQPSWSIVQSYVDDGIITYTKNYTDRAFFLRDTFPCRDEWIVSWNADDQGKITKIVGSHDQVCL